MIERDVNVIHRPFQGIFYLIEFLHALTDPSSVDLRGDIPRSLPSGNTLAE